MSNLVDDTSEQVTVGGSTIGFAVSGATIGSTILPGWGTVIGGVVGAIIGFSLGMLQNYLLDAANDNAVSEPDRKRHPNADQGNPAPWVHGHFVRVPGQLIWMGPILPREVEQQVPDGKKGADSTNKVVTHKYVADVAIAWCRQETIDVITIWANGEIIWDIRQDDPEIPFDVDQVRAYGDNRYQNLEFRIPIAQWPTDFKLWVEGYIWTITASNDGSSLNNGDWQFRSWYYSQDGTQIFLIFRTCTTADKNQNLCGPFADQGPNITLQFTYTMKLNKKISSVSGNLYMDSAPTHYPGDSLQNPDPIMDGWMNFWNWDVDIRPAYRGTSYTMFDKLNVTKWGNQMPRMEALIQVNANPPTTARVLTDIIQRGDTLRGSRIDTTAAEGTLVLGFVIIGPQAIISSVQEIMLYYHLDAFESFTYNDSNPTLLFPLIVFTLRFAGTKFTVAGELRGAHEHGSLPARDHQTITVSDSKDIPNHIVLDFIDPGRAHQVSSVEYFQREAAIPGDTTRKMKTNLVFFASQALWLCRIFLWVARDNRDRWTGSLPPNWLALRTSDRLIWPVNDLSQLTVEVRLTKIVRGQNGLLELEGQLDDTLVYDQVEIPDHIPKYETIPTGPSFSAAYVFDLPPLKAEDATRFGFYYFIQAKRQTISNPTPFDDTGDSRQRNSALLRSDDQGASWDTIGTTNSEGTFGRATTVLGEGVSYAWDLQNTVTIELEGRASSLSNACREEVAAMRRNIAVLGNGEIIGFTTATFVEDRVYILSELLRGMRNTEEKTLTHVVNEEFVLLQDRSFMPFAELDTSDFNRDLEFISLPQGSVVSEVDPYDGGIITPRAETLRPFSVRSRWLRRFPDREIRVYFKWRSRVPFRLFSGVIAPRSETQHCFKVDIFWTAPAAENNREFIRTLCCCYVADAQYYMCYTRQMQIEDFHHTGRIVDGTFPYRMDWEMYQCSDTIGEGRRNVICLNQLTATYVQYDMCPPPV